MKTLFAITHVDRDGFRWLTRPNQGKNHFKSEEQANTHLKNFLKNNNLETIESIFGKQSAGTFAVRPVKCYDNGDAVGIFFEK